MRRRKCVSDFDFRYFLVLANLVGDSRPELLVRQRLQHAAHRHDLQWEGLTLDALRRHVVDGRRKLHALAEGVRGRLDHLDLDQRVIPPIRIVLDRPVQLALYLDQCLDPAETRRWK